MSWATLAIIVMARSPVPAWGATIAAGLMTGLAIATRTGGVITHAYLLGAMSLCALDAVLRHGGAARPLLLSIALRTASVVAIAWMIAIALWPWLQIGNPFTQFADAYSHFATLDASYPTIYWGRDTLTNNLPWWYIPGQLLARLPEGFLVLLVVGIAIRRARRTGMIRTATDGVRQHGMTGLRAPAAGPRPITHDPGRRGRRPSAPSRSSSCRARRSTTASATSCSRCRCSRSSPPAGCCGLVPLLRRTPILSAAIGGLMRRVCWRCS